MLWGTKWMGLAFALLWICATAAPTVSAAEKLKVDSKKSKIGFVGSKPDGKHKGGFKKFSGIIDLDTEDVAANRLRIEIDMASTWSDNSKLTAHLKNADFFEVRKYPKSTFVSTKIVPGDKEHMYEITGDFKLHGVKKSIKIPVKVEIAEKRLILDGKFSIDRTDFGIVYGKGKILDKVAIKVHLEAARK